MISIPRSELSISFARAGGPGGQNVNKVSSKVLVRWRPATSAVLSDEVKARLLAQQQHRLTTEGDLLITSQRYRDQARNLDDCLEKLEEIIGQAMVRPKVRRPTRPSRGSRERRHQAKQHRSRTKAGRKAPRQE